ncbi:fungal protein [Schizosaccharomyces cryophilus OY26]|uniref:Fungal protein n=1 Tax=Schizosaccharomyces cryophilus (strain OY26 / ATCC MYA-4695 / CBS 11777 / NBRC 106824 / NRRL Y48691) TaxID=653667 RepID=S9VPX1_SCHCR|nr:uncharacterized protein SPOG_03472 [Schizosaccharomyces cryophilus OY26]EPY50003.1 fungal protein [Schizosaccharomyces cryophilus OY26]
MAPSSFVSFWKRIFSNKDQETSSVKNADDFDLKRHALEKNAYDEDLSSDPNTFFNRKNIHMPRILYLMLCSVGSFIISGGLEFAIAYVRLWRLPDTLSGDLAVTNFAQAIVTYWIESALVQADLRSGLVRPVYFGWWPKNTFMREILRAKPNYHFNFIVFRWMEWLVFTALRGLFWSIPLWFLLWPASIGILCAPGNHFGNDYYYNNYPAPQVVKLVFGGVLGFVITPWIAFLHMYMYGHYQYMEKNQQQIASDKDLESQRNVAGGAFPTTTRDMSNSERASATPAPPTSSVNHFPTPSSRSEANVDAPISSFEGLSETVRAPQNENMPSTKQSPTAEVLEPAEQPLTDFHPHPVLNTHTTSVYESSAAVPSDNAVHSDNRRLYSAVDHPTEIGSPVASPEMVHHTTVVNGSLNSSINSYSHNSAFDSSDNDGFSLVTAPSIAPTSSSVANSAAPSVNGDAPEEIDDSASSNASVTTKKPN